MTVSMADMRLSPIRARLLGPADIRLGDRQLVPGPWPRRQARWMFLLLLATPGHHLPRDQLLDLLWPDMPLPAALNALYKALHALRRTLEPDLATGRDSSYVELRDDVVGIVDHPGFWVDLDRVRGHLTQQSSTTPHLNLRRALELFRGDFLPGEPYADWAVDLRTALAAERRTAVLRLAALDLQADQPLRSVDLLESALAADPADEEIARTVAQNLAAGGQVRTAIHHLERCHVALLQETGFGLDQVSETLRQTLFTRAERLAIGPAGDRLTIRHLPTPQTSTIGRTVDIIRIVDLIRSGTRLVTITGPGGVGKTRLATEVVGALTTAEIVDGAFIDFTVTNEADQCFALIASAFGIQAQPGVPPEQVIQAALRRSGPVLLVLDNLEHLPGMHTWVADLLQRVPNLVVIATSRTTLRIRAEHVVHLQPLLVPDSRENDRAVLANAPAVRLFLQCLSAWRGDVESVTAQELPVIARLCEALDGLPLAIEIAAARCVEQSPAAILQQITVRLSLIGDGPQDLPPRQRALEAAIDWSYRLLDPATRRAFRHLSVFVGGANEAAIQAVIGADGVHLVDVLVAHSLATWRWQGGQRVADMLETIRQFARERLVESGELDQACLAHALHLVTVAEETDPRSSPPRSLGWTHMEYDEPNMQAALAWCRQAERHDLIIRMTVARGAFWFVHGTAPTTLPAIEGAIQSQPPNDPDTIAWAALWGAGLAGEQRDAATGERLERLARQTWESLGSAAGTARVDHSVAMRWSATGRAEEAVVIFQRNVPIFRRVGDQEGVVFSLAGLAQGQRELGGDPGEAVKLLEEAMEIAAAGGTPHLQTYVVVRLLGILLAAGDVDRAEAVARQANRVIHLASAWQSLPLLGLGRATIAARQGDTEAVTHHARSAHQAAQEFATEHLVWQTTSALLVAATLRGDLDEGRATTQQLANRLADPRAVRERQVVLPDLACLAWLQGHTGPEIDHARHLVAAEQFLTIPLPHSSLAGHLTHTGEPLPDHAALFEYITSLVLA